MKICRKNKDKIQDKSVDKSQKVPDYKSEKTTRVSTLREVFLPNQTRSNLFRLDVLSGSTRLQTRTSSG